MTTPSSLLIFSQQRTTFDVPGVFIFGGSNQPRLLLPADIDDTLNKYEYLLKNYMDQKPFPVFQETFHFISNYIISGQEYIP